MCLCQTVTWLIISFIPQAVFFRGLQGRTEHIQIILCLAPRYKKGQMPVAPNFKFPWPVKPEGSWAQNYQLAQGLETNLISVLNGFNHKNLTLSCGGERGKKASDLAEEGVRMTESRFQLCTSINKQGRNKANLETRVRSGEIFF